MKGGLYIDGKDAYTRYGITLCDCRGLAAYPPLKSITTTDYPDEDGIRADLSAPKLDSRTFDVTLVVHDVFSADAFVKAAADGKEHRWNFARYGVTKTLYVKSYGTMSKTAEMAKMTMTLVDNYPLEGYTYSTPQSSAHDLGYTIDGRNFARYGIVPLQGTEAQLLAPFEPKVNLSVTNRTMNGADYDSSAAKKASRDATIYLLLHCDKDNFWGNYNAFLYDLVRSGSRTIGFSPHSKAYSRSFGCYYKSSRVEDFAASGGKIWCKFSITVCMINR